MKKKLSSISFILFLIAVVSYFSMLTGIDKLLILAVICSAAGLILALFSERGKNKAISIVGNSIILIVSIVIPFVVTTFFWNRP